MVGGRDTLAESLREGFGEDVCAEGSGGAEEGADSDGSGAEGKEGRIEAGHGEAREEGCHYLLARGWIVVTSAATRLGSAAWSNQVLLVLGTLSSLTTLKTQFPRY